MSVPGPNPSASTSYQHPPPRNPHPYADPNLHWPGKSKLPDRTAAGAPNPNPPPLGAGSSLARHPPPPPPSNPPGRGGFPERERGEKGVLAALGGERGAREGGGEREREREREREYNPMNEISEEQRDEVNEAFTLFDLDRDRHLDYHELRVALRALGFQLSKPDLLSILQTHGVPRPSSAAAQNPKNQPPHPSQLLIPHPSFQHLAATKILERDPLEEINRAFDLFDQDGKGFIDVEDLRRVARELGETGLEEEELRAMVEEFDLEGRGGVDRGGFVGICLG